MSEEELKFILDPDLFPLCKALRILGFDAVSRAELSLKAAIGHAIEERRIWVRKEVITPSLQYGVRYFIVQSDEMAGQLHELNSTYSLADCAEPFSRCLKCNQLLVDAERLSIEGKVPERVFASFKEFSVCPGCSRVYWPGTHLQRMKKKLETWGWSG